MYEPRGHRDMYGAVLLPPYRPDADIAVLFMHNEGYSTMCGHGVIALTTGLIEEGLYPAAIPATTIRWETPAGLVTAVAAVELGEDGGPEVSGVRFTNVPSYLHQSDINVVPRGARSGASAAGLRRSLLRHRGCGGPGAAGGARCHRRPDRGWLGHHPRPPGGPSPTHPTDADLGFVYGTIIVDQQPATAPDGRATDATMRNVTVFAEAEVDRSPCGSGTSALLAWLHATGRLEPGRDIRNASITGAVFEGRVESVTTLGPSTRWSPASRGRAMSPATTRSWSMTATPSEAASCCGSRERMGMATTDLWAELDGPIGRLSVAWGPAGVTLVERAGDAAGFELDATLRTGRPVMRVPHVPAPLARQIGRQLAGEHQPDLLLDFTGLTWFAGAALRKTMEIPWGEVRPYSWIAREIGRPLAVRAVGSTMASNPLPFVIRVIVWSAPMAISASTAPADPPRSARCWARRTSTRTHWTDSPI